MFRKASIQKGSIDMLDGVVLHKRKKPLNVLALKQKKSFYLEPYRNVLEQLTANANLLKNKD